MNIKEDCQLLNLMWSTLNTKIKTYTKRLKCSAKPLNLLTQSLFLSEFSRGTQYNATVFSLFFTHLSFSLFPLSLVQCLRERTIHVLQARWSVTTLEQAHCYRLILSQSTVCVTVCNYYFFDGHMYVLHAVYATNPWLRKSYDILHWEMYSAVYTPAIFPTKCI